MRRSELTRKVQELLRGDVIVDAGPDFIVLESGAMISLTTSQCAALNEELGGNNDGAEG